MIRHPLGLRLDPARPIRDQIHEAARLGARGVVIDAIGDLAPQRLSETGRRELRHLLRTLELSLVALSLPTRRPFDTIDQLDERMRRADAAFAMAYELGTNLVLARVGAVPRGGRPGTYRDLHHGAHFAGPAGRPPRCSPGHRDRLGKPGPAQGFPRFAEPGRASRKHRPLKPARRGDRPGGDGRGALRRGWRTPTPATRRARRRPPRIPAVWVSHPGCLTGKPTSGLWKKSATAGSSPSGQTQPARHVASGMRSSPVSRPSSKASVGRMNPVPHNEFVRGHSIKGWHQNFLEVLE